MLKRFLNQKGMMLVEVLMAMLILAIIIFSFSRLFTSSYAGIYNAGYKSEALFKAQQKMENAINDTSFVDPEVTYTPNHSITITSSTPHYWSETFYGTKIEVSEPYTTNAGIEKRVSISCFKPD